MSEIPLTTSIACPQSWSDEFFTGCSKRGIYSARARIIPDSNGTFQIAVLNVSETDVTLNNHQFMGFLYPPAPDAHAKGLETEQGVKQFEQSCSIGANLDTVQGEAIISLLHSYSQVFAENPNKPQLNNILSHRITTNESLPIKQKPRRIPHAWEQEIDQQVTEILNNNIIRPSSSPWNSPIILVKKRDNSLRFVCDFRRLNDVTKKDSYPLPHIQDVIDKMNGSRYWSTLDAASAYWSIPLT